jgi:hypothetical protein
MIASQHFSTVWNHMAKVICIVPHTTSIYNRVSILMMLKFYGFLNTAVVYAKPSGSVHYEILGSLAQDFKIINDPLNSSLVFPDKLRNMTGYAYRIPVYNQPPRVRIVKRRLSSPIVFFFQALSTIQNSNLKPIFLHNSSFLRRYWLSKEMDLSMNTANNIVSNEPKLLTYETKSYCALVPIPPKTSLTQLIFVEPFDGLTWMFFALSVVGCVAVFWMFRSRGAVDSPWLLGYGMFVYFIGQGVDFSRRNRMVLTILLQLIVLMIFVLSNAYEGVITSFMIQPLHEIRMKTVQDLLTSDYEILTDEAFIYTVRDYNEFQAIGHRLTTQKGMSANDLNDLIINKRKVIIKECLSAEYELHMQQVNDRNNDRLFSDYYYMLPESIASKYLFLEASFANPFIERLQYYMDLCFQAGLQHFWKVFINLDFYKEPKYVVEEVEYLKLEDLYQVFSILAVGYALATLVLLVEIFLHDCLKSLNLRYLAHKLRNRVNKMAYKKKPRDPKYQAGALYYIIHRHQKIKRLRPNRLKVRQIFVQPVNREE